MSEKKYHIKNLHEENRFWVKELLFYKEELNYFENQLGIIAINYTSIDVMAKVEHFQNQFIRQREVIDELKHDIKASENKIEAFAKTNNEIAIEHALFEDHSSLRENLTVFKKIYDELKSEFRIFLAKYL